MSISAMALALAVVLEFVAPLRSWDQQLADWVGSLGLGGELRPLAPHWAWLWTALMILGLTQSMLHVRGTWRRWILAVTVFVLTLAWVPILALWSQVPALVAHLIALAWAAIGSMIYAERHREPD